MRNKNKLLLALLPLMVACNNTTQTKQVVKSVKVETITNVDPSSATITLPATVNELQETKLSFRVGGPLQMLNDVVGTYVSKGQTIARIDQRDFKIALDAAEARYALAKAEYDRYKSLETKGSVAKSTFDQIETQYKLTKAEAEAAANALADTELKAPFSGYINMVIANNYETVAPGQPIVTLLDMSQYEVNAWVSTADAPKINSKATYTCVIEQNGEQVELQGRLKEIGNKTSFTKHSLPLTVVVDGAATLKLQAGVATYLKVGVTTEAQADQITIPTTAIVTKDDAKKVWIYDAKSSSVTGRTITTGEISDDGRIVITSGLNSGEVIITAGVNYLFEGDTVKLLERDSKSNVGNKI